MLKENYNKSEIARAIGKHKSVVHYEIKRNSDKRSGVYNDDLANRKYAKRQKEKRKHKRFTVELQAV
ncbi:MAG: helix-turn-helix domain-containing protein, partial [Polaribacter sp.]